MVDLQVCPKHIWSLQLTKIEKGTMDWLHDHKFKTNLGYRARLFIRDIDLEDVLSHQPC